MSLGAWLSARTCLGRAGCMAWWAGTVQRSRGDGRATTPERERGESGHSHRLRGISACWVPVARERGDSARGYPCGTTDGGIHPRYRQHDWIRRGQRREGIPSGRVESGELVGVHGARPPGRGGGGGFGSPGKASAGPVVQGGTGGKGVVVADTATVRALALACPRAWDETLFLLRTDLRTRLTATAMATATATATAVMTHIEGRQGKKKWRPWRRCPAHLENASRKGKNPPAMVKDPLGLLCREPEVRKEDWGVGGCAGCAAPKNRNGPSPKAASAAHARTRKWRP